MESAPINLRGPLAQKRQLLARLMAQQQAQRGSGRPMAGFRAGAMGGRAVHNASDLAAAPLPAINLGFQPGAGPMPGGFFNDLSVPITQFPGGQPWAPAGGVDPTTDLSSESGAPGLGLSLAPGQHAAPAPATWDANPSPFVAPSSFGGTLRSVTGVPSPDPWKVFTQPFVPPPDQRRFGAA